MSKVHMFTAERVWEKSWMFGVGVGFSDDSPGCLLLCFGPWLIAIGPHTRNKKEGES